MSHGEERLRSGENRNKKLRQIAERLDALVEAQERANELKEEEIELRRQHLRRMD